MLMTRHKQIKTQDFDDGMLAKYTYLDKIFLLFEIKIWNNLTIFINYNCG